LAGLWSNSDSELSQEINAQKGTCHCGMQKFCCKKLALKLEGFGNETSRGNWLAIGTLNPIIHTVWLDSHALTLKNYTAQYCEVRKI
jgi:hypothetical protein